MGSHKKKVLFKLTTLPQLFVAKLLIEIKLIPYLYSNFIANAKKKRSVLVDLFSPKYCGNKA